MKRTNSTARKLLASLAEHVTLAKKEAQKYLAMRAQQLLDTCMLTAAREEIAKRDTLLAAQLEVKRAVRNGEDPVAAVRNLIGPESTHGCFEMREISYWSLSTDSLLATLDQHNGRIRAIRIIRGLLREIQAGSDKTT
jgi:hypothetical protein